MKAFEHGEIGPDLFRAACRMGLEGLVSKHRDRAYRGGPCRHRVKVNAGDEARGRGGLVTLMGYALEGVMSFYLWFIHWLSNSLIDTFRIPEEWDPIVEAVCFYGLPFVLYWSVYWLVYRFYNSGRQNQATSNRGRGGLSR